jgi:hypothetical protein
MDEPCPKDGARKDKPRVDKEWRQSGQRVENDGFLIEYRSEVDRFRRLIL